MTLVLTIRQKKQEIDMLAFRRVGALAVVKANIQPVRQICSRKGGFAAVKADLQPKRRFRSRESRLAAVKADLLP